MATWRESEGRWASTARIGGKKRFFYSRASAKDADDQAQAAKEAWSQRQSDASTDTPSFLEGTLADLVYSVWWPRTKAGGIKPTTKAFYEELLTLHILPRLGHLRVSEIGLVEVQACIDSLTNQRTGAPLGKKRKKEAAVLLRSILRLHKTIEETRTGRVVRSDWELLRTPKVRRKKDRHEPSPKLTLDLMKAAKGTWLEGPVFCAMFLGLRRGEICGLRWAHVDRINLRLTVCEQRHELLPDGDTLKNDSSRVLPMTLELIEHLQSLGDGLNRYLFTKASDAPTTNKKYRKGAHPIHPNGLTEAVTSLCREAGYPGVTLHDLRAYAASNLGALGVDPVTIMEILGHSKLDTTYLYLYSQEEKRRQALKRLFDTKG